MTLSFAIFASGRGSNAVKLIEAFKSGSIPARIALVVSNIEDAAVLERAREHDLPTLAISHKGKSRQVHEKEILAHLNGIDHILLAGYLRVLSPYFLQNFKGKILNIHPALLPAFPGLHAAERQWEAGLKIAGATVHFVDDGVDTGPILLQGSLEVRGDEGPDGLAARILHEIEHDIYPRAVRLFIESLQEIP
jgi:phosphoribosylglycinamide formyltransferase 1